MCDCVQQRCPQPLASLPGLQLVRELLRPGALEADRHQVCDALHDRIRHLRPLQGQRRNRLGAEPDRGYDALLRGIREGYAVPCGLTQLIL